MGFVIRISGSDICEVHLSMSKPVFKCTTHFLVSSSENLFYAGAITRNCFILRSLSRIMEAQSPWILHQTYLSKDLLRAVDFPASIDRVHPWKRGSPSVISLPRLVPRVVPSLSISVSMTHPYLGHANVSVSISLYTEVLSYTAFVTSILNGQKSFPASF